MTLLPYRIFILLLAVIAVCAQVSPALAQEQRVVDSLENIVRTAKHDTIITKALNDLAWEYRKSDEAKATAYANRALSLAVKTGNKRGEALATYVTGLINDFAGNYETALYHYRKALKIYEALGDKKRVASTYNNIGAVYSFQGNYDKSIEYYLRSLAIKEELGDKKAIASTLNNLGTIYENKRELEKALDYYLQAMKLKEQIHDEKGPIAASYANVGSVYQSLNKKSEALEYYNRAVKLYQEVNDLNGLALTYNSLGSLYGEMGQTALALEYFRDAYNMQQKMGDKWGMSYSQLGMGDIHLRAGNHRLAIEHLQKGIAGMAGIGSLKEQADGYELLSKAYEGMNDSRNALYAFKSFYELRDSIGNEENNRAIVEMQTKYETAKKEKQIEKLNKEQALRDKEKQKEKIVIYSLIALSVLGTLLAFVLLRGYLSKQRSNRILSQQRDELDHQKKLIEEKNREISESIEYARYIQEATLPVMCIRDLAPDSMLLYLPKDVVSGDFYWLERDSEALYFVAADCTGHGVPGAFMSMIGTMLLNEIFNEKKIRRPGDMITQVNRLIKMSLKQHDHLKRTQDGMDMAATRYHPQTRTFETAAANRPVWIIRRGAIEVEIIRPDKASVGGMTAQDYSFSSQQVKLEPGDCFYLFTDGYADQFGQETGKKMMTSRFKQLLLSVCDQPMSVQQQKVERFFTEWKGDREQIDDVLVMGVRV